MADLPVRGLAIVQSFRNHTIPDWIARCLDSVRTWASFRNHSYYLWGDEIYDLCGPDYLSRGLRNPQGITNLARLLVTRDYLQSGHAAVVWLDADVFVFDPQGLDLDFPAGTFELGYALGQEVWLGEDGVLGTRSAHNALTYFTPNARDLDFLIDAIRHIDAGRAITSNFQVGVRLLRGLQYSLGFELIPNVAMFSPRLMDAIRQNDVTLMRRYGHVFGAPSQAANLCLSIAGVLGESAMMEVMSLLERSRGDVINRHAGASLSHFERLKWGASTIRARSKRR